MQGSMGSLSLTCRSRSRTKSPVSQHRYGIDPIFLITRTTDDARIKKIAGKARGYLYLVSVLGVTGVREKVPEEALELLHRVRRHTDLPLALGFGISTRTTQGHVLQPGPMASS